MWRLCDFDDEDKEWISCIHLQTLRTEIKIPSTHLPKPTPQPRTSHLVPQLHDGLARLFGGNDPEGAVAARLPHAHKPVPMHLQGVR